MIQLRVTSVYLLAVLAAPAASISIGSGTNWTVTAGGTGAVNVTPFLISGNTISITSDDSATGTFVTGGTAASFNNYWTAQFSFVLPANASNVVLNFGNLSADDRTVLELNGVIIGSNGLLNPSSGCTTGAMVMTNGGSNNPYTFCAGTNTGSVTSGFNIGGSNTLMAIINNTNTGINGNLAATFAAGGPTVFGVTGSVSFTPTPEPASAALAGAGLLGLLWRVRSKRTGA